MSKNEKLISALFILLWFSLLIYSIMSDIKEKKRKREKKLKKEFFWSQIECGSFHFWL